MSQHRIQTILELPYQIEYVEVAETSAERYVCFASSILQQLASQRWVGTAPTIPLSACSRTLSDECSAAGEAVVLAAEGGEGAEMDGCWSHEEIVKRQRSLSRRTPRAIVYLCCGHMDCWVHVGARRAVERAVAEARKGHQWGVGAEAATIELGALPSSSPRR